MIRLILGRAGTGKTARIFEEIARDGKNHPGGVVLLVPEQYSHEAERELCRAAGDGLSLYGEVLSFTGLARKVFAQCGGVRSMMDGGGRLLCMAVAAEAVSGSLRVYTRGTKDPRMLDGLLRAVEELKLAGVDGTVLGEAAGRTEGVLAEKLRDLSLLLEAYTAAEGRSAADPAEILEALAEQIGESPSAKAHFYIDGFTDFTELEKNVLRRLISAGAEMTVCLTCSPEGDEGVFALPMATARWFQATATAFSRECREEWMENGSRENTALGWFSGHLFDFGTPEAPEGREAIRLVSAADIYEECELAAARMSELARGGARWREMAVAIRGFGDYRTALECACARYGVPLFLSGRGDILRKSVPMLISCALEAVNRGYEYEAVFGALKTGFMPLTAEECDRLENYVILWGIRGTMWDRPWNMHPDGYNQEMNEKARERLAELNDLRSRTVEPLKRLETAVKTAKTAREQAGALAAFLEDISLAERLECRGEELEKNGRQETAAEYERLWDIVCSALEQFASVLGEMAMDGPRFAAFFALMLSKYDTGVIPVSLDRVQAGDMDGMRRRHTKHLLVLGAADGRLPAPGENGGVFTPDERELLSGLGLPLGGAEEELSRELGTIYNCLSLPAETLYMSWPRMDGEGGEGRPSLIAERARALFGIRPEVGDVLKARTFSRDAAFALALQGQAGDENKFCRAAREYFSREGEEPRLVAMADAARAGRGRLGSEAVRALYGERPSLSPTRAERFSRCRFGYFLQYGLKAKPRQRAVFDPRDYGTFMHYVLENVARETKEMGGFGAVTAEQIGKLTDRYVDRYIREEMNDFAEKTTRFAYLFRRLRHTVRRVTEDMWEELKDSRFQPLEMELDLTKAGVLSPAREDEVPLTGKVDRVDGWVKGNTLYLRVTDYKTGVKKFSLSDVCEGMNMQMLLYLFALQSRGQEYFGYEKILPAGVLYSSAQFKTLSADRELSDEELEKLRQGSIRRSGLVLEDEAVLEAMEPGLEKRFLPVKFKKEGGFTADSQIATLEQFGALHRYIRKTLSDLAAELRAGSVAADPWFKSVQDNSCVFCDYQEACLYDEERDCRRIRTRLKPVEAWEKIEGSHE